MIKRILKSGLLILLAAIGYLALWPVPIDPQVWDSPEFQGFKGDYQTNQKLDEFTRLTMGNLTGPEAAVQAPNGNIVATTHEGWIVMWEEGDTESQNVIDVGGRPLGLAFDATGNLWIANAYTGIQKLTPGGELELVLTEVDGLPLLYADDIDVSANGLIYFSDASTKFSAEKYKSTLAASLLDIFEHTDSGRLIEYNPQTGAAKTVLDKMTFANGVALSETGDFVLVAETGEYRVHKLWLQGERQGQSEIVIDNLPGFPDNIHRGLNGRFWIGMTSPRSKVVDDLSEKPFWRKVVQRLPSFLRPKVVHHGIVLAIDADGQVLANLQSPGGKAYATTGAWETDDKLYVTSLTAPFLAQFYKQGLGLND